MAVDRIQPIIELKHCEMLTEAGFDVTVLNSCIGERSDIQQPPGIRAFQEGEQCAGEDRQSGGFVVDNGRVPGEVSEHPAAVLLGAGVRAGFLCPGERCPI